MAMSPIGSQKIRRASNPHAPQPPCLHEDVPNLNMSGVPYERIAWKCDSRVQSRGLPINAAAHPTGAMRLPDSDLFMRDSVNFDTLEL